MPNSSANATNGTGTGFNFAGVVLDRLCPGNDAADIQSAAPFALRAHQLTIFTFSPGRNVALALSPLIVRNRSSG